MTTTTKHHLLLLLAIASCTDSSVSYIPGFKPPKVESGYTRFVTPTVEDIQPGDNVLLCQWVEAPIAHDRQVDATTGYQSVGGHHVALYATSEIQPVGTSRPCTVQDMLNVTFVGAVGAEGLNAVPIPEGMAFTVPSGFALMTNTHYINVTDNVIDGQSVIDVKFGDPKHPEHAVGNVAVNNESFTLPPNQVTTADGYCKAPTQMSLFMWANHMHEWGAHVMSEVIRDDGVRLPLAEDDSWDAEMTFNPTWVTFPVTAPLVVQEGWTFHTQCTWNNTTSASITFPTEMCVSTGFTLEDMPMLVCPTTPTM